MGSLPIDVISDILARLPVKYLLRSKSVCKSWFTLITSKHFINFHLRLNTLSSSDKLLLFSSSDHSLYSVTFDSLESPPTKLSYFSDNGPSFSGFGGSCNGLLLCFSNDNNNNDASNNDVYLVNPSTFQYRKIPKLKVPKSHVCVNYGFGYDHKTDDYKVIRIVILVYGCEDGPVFNAREVMVYSLKANSWRFIEEKISDYATLASRNGALVNNHLLHWMFWCISKKEHRISSFNLCNEQWSEIPMPDYVEIGLDNHRKGLECNGDYKKIDVLHLGVLDERLCLLTRKVQNNMCDVGMWVMKEYGVKKSWVKLLNISDLNVSRSLKVVPIAYSERYSEILFRTEKELNVFRYDLKKKRTTRLEIPGLSNFDGVSACIRSIVPLICHGEIDA
ncbi:F-box protein CPR1 [Bienertia sinuspersici]